MNELVMSILLLVSSGILHALVVYRRTRSS